MERGGKNPETKSDGMENVIRESIYFGGPLAASGDRSQRNSRPCRGVDISHAQNLIIQFGIGSLITRLFLPFI